MTCHRVLSAAVRVQLSRRPAPTRQAVSSGSISKGSKPDRVMFAPIPKNFKGAVLIPDLVQAWKQHTGMK